MSHRVHQKQTEDFVHFLFLWNTWTQGQIRSTKNEQMEKAIFHNINKNLKWPDIWGFYCVKIHFWNVYILLKYAEL